MPLLRQNEIIKIKELKDELLATRRDAKVEEVGLHDIEFHINDNDPHFKIRDDTVKMTGMGLGAFSDFLHIPAPFMKRVGKEVGHTLQQTMLESLLDVAGGSGVRVVYTEDGIQSVTEVGRRLIDPIEIVNIAENTLGTSDAQITRLVNLPSEFSFDVAVPENFDRGIGGDRPSQGNEIGDVTAGGLSFYYNRKLNHTPEIASYSYRLVCTNGMVTEDRGLRVEGRGKTVEEVLADINAMAERAFSRVERQISHFYALRQERVANPEQWLIRVAEEQRIPDRSLNQLIRTVASDEVPDDASVFDMTNLVTNLANDPNLREGGRRTLELAGGAVIEDEASRCAHCQSKLNH